MLYICSQGELLPFSSLCFLFAYPSLFFEQNCLRGSTEVIELVFHFDSEFEVIITAKKTNDGNDKTNFCL